MNVILVDLPEKQIAYIKENCKRLWEMESIYADDRIEPTKYKNFTQEQKKESIMISQNPMMLAMALQNEMATIAYQNPNDTDKPAFPEVDMIVEGFEEVDERFLERVYKRHHHLPWTILETKRLLVRELELSDLDALFEMYAYEGMTEYMEDLYSYEEEYKYQKAYIEYMYRFYGYGMWLVFDKETKKLIGRAGLEHREELNGEVELGYAIAKPYWGRGYATEVCKAILSYAREELGFETIFSLIEPENLKSIHLAQKLGFQFLEERKIKQKNYKIFTRTL